jgi:hypothetical protein
MVEFYWLLGTGLPICCFRAKKNPAAAGFFSALLASRRNNAYKLPTLVALLFKLYSAISYGEQSVVTTHIDVLACMETRSALPDQDIACPDGLAAIAFHTQVLGV